MCNSLYKSIMLFNQLSFAVSTVLVQLNVENEVCSGEGVVVPFNAVAEYKDIPNNKCTWRCNEGFFSTKSRSTFQHATTISICKKCTPNTQCGVGFTASQCSRTDDSKCVQCPDLEDSSGQKYYLHGDCRTKTCKEGYIIHPNSTECSICPIDHFCTNNKATPCPENCSTRETPGCITPFACVAKSLQSASDQEYTTVTLQSTVMISSNANVKTSKMKCPALNYAISTWNQHGNLQDCSIDILSTFHAIVNCDFLISPCTVIYYKVWLSEKFSEYKPSVFQSIFQCLQLDSMQQLSLGNPIIQQNLETLIMNGGVDQQNVPPKDPPVLTVEPQRWYLDRDQIITTIALFYLWILASSCSLILICALLILKMRRKQIVKDLFHKLTKLRREVAIP